MGRYRLDWFDFSAPMRPNSSREVGAPRCLATFAALACRPRERSPRGTVAFEEITGMPWIEIDFAADIERANAEVLPRILTAGGNRGEAMVIEREMKRGVAQGL
jgi:hypothetical protein